MDRGEVDAERLKRDFVSMISHELRTPLTTLTGFSELLATRGESLEPQLVSEFGQRMWRASRWLSRMVGDLLDVSQLEQGSLVLDIEATDVAQVLEEVAAIDVADRRPFSHTAEPGMPPVLADPARLRQVLGNLLSNARKFSTPGSPIAIEAIRRGGRVEISVQDHGRGIGSEHLDRIFEPFVQTDPATTREAGGLGTGLYLVKELCDRMGAHVRVESEEGFGSRFTVSLQIAGTLEATA
jgi:signal transduction histidine kinase